MKLINEWKQAWKYLSVQFNVIGIILLSILVELPNHLVVSWSLLPSEVKDILDKEHLVYIGIVFMILSTLGRIISQTKENDDVK